MNVKRTLVVSMAVGVGLLASAGASYAVSIDISSASVDPGATATVRVTLNAAGEQVGATMNDITFSPNARLVSCAVDPSTGGQLSTVRFQPKGCTPGVNCERARALILRSNGQPIPDGALLYSCEVKVADNAGASTFPLNCASASASSVAGKALAVNCANASVQVNTSVGGSADSSAASGGGGCAVRSGRTSHSGATAWLVLPAAVLIWRRRRRVAR